jgi:hypothetical protein
MPKSTGVWGIFEAVVDFINRLVSPIYTLVSSTTFWIVVGGVIVAIIVGFAIWGIIKWFQLFM